MSYEPTTWARGTKITAQKLNNIERGVESVNSEYTPTTWAEGDIVTATKLNNIEQGIANASGGGGDFSTAEVTVINNTEDVILYLPNTNDEEGWTHLGATVYGNGVHTVVLYKGAAHGELSADAELTVTGDISTEDGIIVTGNGTITINPYIST